ncbi:MAG: aminotransferase class I/II-fold pyridoxal phosphate-dependent enzyme [Limnochordia bacterium]|jgi:arginine decarboxylase
MEEQQGSAQETMPLFSGLLAYAAGRPLPFHIPGHKQGAGMAPEFRDFLGSNALSIDLVNIPPVDDLHRPRGMIKEAQALAAEAFGADHTLFAVQGTSGAIMAMIIACVRPGEKILIPRNVHRAVMTGIVLSGALPVFMTPEIDTEFGVAHGVSVSTVRRALGEHPDARALLLVNPTYFGVVSDLQAIVEVAHERDVPVLVDEAHGAHLYFHPSLPMSAMAAGADVAATSVHKLGGSLTQSSVLNVRNGFVNPQRIQAVLSMLTTTSTSYLLLASLDAARKQLATRGREMLDAVIALAEWARDEINAIPGLCCLGKKDVGSLSSSHGYDPTKLFISVKGLGLSGLEVEQLLRDRYRIEIEMSDLYNILAIVTFADRGSTVAALVKALREIAEGVGVRRPRLVHVRLPDLPRLALTPREAFYRNSEPVALADSAGRIAAEFVMVYPPGIPLLLPGELIEQKNLDYIGEHIRAGLPVQGPEDVSLRTIRVVAD